jgi:uncharacterized protein YehS (DUF1456 family)
MTNNDILRRLRYALELDNATLLRVFAEGDVILSAAELAALLKQDEEPGFEPLDDVLLGHLLDGLINHRRGKRELTTPAPLLPMNNNRVLRSLKIALSLRDDDVLAIMEAADFPLSKSELSALFRREGHPNFQPCGNQILRNFLRGLAQWHRRGGAATPSDAER